MYYLTILCVLVTCFIVWWYISTYRVLVLIFLPLSGPFLRRFLYPFRKLDRKPERVPYVWKLYTYFLVINLFALTAYTIIDVAIDNKLSTIFRYWFFVLLGSVVPFVIGGIYYDIQRVRHGGDLFTKKAE